MSTDDYVSHFDSCHILPAKLAAVDAAVNLIDSHRAVYKQVEAATHVPWYVVGGIHFRECSCSMTKHLHNGDPLSARTVDVPAGRLPAPAQPPFTFLQSAVDALALAKMTGMGTLPIGSILRRLEEYNGLGYRAHHDNTPYLWDGTDLYAAGLFVSDGEFSPTAVDGQPGVAAILLRMYEQGIIALLGEPLQVTMGGKKAAVPAYELRGTSFIGARAAAAALGGAIAGVENNPSGIEISFKGTTKTLSAKVIDGTGYVAAASLAAFVGRPVSFVASGPTLAFD